MQVAQRVARIPPYPFREIAALKAKALAEGQDLIDFGIGDPDQPTPSHIIEAFADEIHNPEWHRYDETGFGDPELRQAISRFGKRRFGIEVSPENEIQVATGSKDSLALINWAFVDPGDIVLVPDPAYSVYRVNAIFCSGTPFPMPLSADNGFRPDLSAIPPTVARAAKLMFLNYPNNPTGAVADVAFFEDVVRFAKEHQLIVAHDAAYAQIAYDGCEPASILHVEGAKDVCIEFHSFSKTYNMTGWRLGWSWGGAAIVGALSRLKSNVDNGVFRALQRAGAEALTQSQQCVQELCAMYQRRRDRLVAGLQSLGCPAVKPKATFYVWVPVPKGYTSEGFARSLLVDCGVLVVPGGVYGDHGEGYVRFTLTIVADDPEARIAEAIRRIEDNLEVAW